MSDLFQQFGVRVLADHLLPGDRIRHAGRTLLVQRVAVTHHAATVLDVLAANAGTEKLQLGAEEFVELAS